MAETVATKPFLPRCADSGALQSCPLILAVAAQPLDGLGTSPGGDRCHLVRQRTERAALQMEAAMRAVDLHLNRARGLAKAFPKCADGSTTTIVYRRHSARRPRALARSWFMSSSGKTIWPKRSSGISAETGRAGIGPAAKPLPFFKKRSKRTLR
jgi:hypothetical protein